MFPPTFLHFFAKFSLTRWFVAPLMTEDFERNFKGGLYYTLILSARAYVRIYIITCSRTLHPIHPPMKRTVSSFTSEHLQLSLQPCNGNIPHYGPTGYGGRSSATGNAHLPQHRDRCGRWVSAHLQQEHADFQTSGLPLQMCMWFYMTRRKHKQWWVWWRGWRVETQTSMYRGHKT